MSDPSDVLNEKQQAVVRKLAEKRDTFLERAPITAEFELSETEYDHLVHYLESHDAMEILPVMNGQYASDIMPTQGILEIVRQLDSRSRKGAAMDVLISWSKTQSHNIAGLIYEWLPKVLPGIQPWKSDEDIDKGTKWFTELQQFLGSAKQCIICVTPENVRSPWLYYEAGAIAMKGDDARICAFLAGVDPNDLRDGPLSQFQCTVANRDDTFRLIKSLNRTLPKPTDELPLREIFDSNWPKFESDLAKILAVKFNSPANPIILATDSASVGLSPEAIELLREAARDKNGQIFYSRNMRGHEISSNGRQLVEVGNPRSEAMWKSAIEELIELKLLEDRGGKREVFTLKKRGYDIAAQLPHSASDQTPMQPQYDDNDIVSLLEGYLGKVTGGLDVDAFKFDEVDRTVGLPLGSSARLLEKAAQKFDYHVKRKGTNTISFIRGSSHAPSVVNPNFGRDRNW